MRSSRIRAAASLPLFVARGLHAAGRLQEHVLDAREVSGLELLLKNGLTIFNALERRASDIHIESRDQEVAIKYRIDGVLHYAMPPVAKDWHSTIISRIKVMSELDIAERRVPQDGRFRVRYKSRLIPGGISRFIRHPTD